MTNEQLRFEVTNDGIAIATIDNEARLNSLSREVVDGLVETYARVDASPDIHALVLTGTGRAFCTGADIRLMGELRASADGYAFIEWVARTCTGLEAMDKPAIAAVNGFALGGGAEICLAADIVIASERATFGFPEATIGNVPGFGILRLAEFVGRQKAKELMMTGARLSPAEAQALGLVNQVVSQERLLDAALEMARRILAGSPASVRLIKRGVNRRSGGEELAYWVNTVGPLAVSDDAREGVHAFLEKRRPVFKDRNDSG